MAFGILNAPGSDVMNMLLRQMSNPVEQQKEEQKTGAEATAEEKKEDRPC